MLRPSRMGIGEELVMVVVGKYVRDCCWVFGVIGGVASQLLSRCGWCLTKGVVVAFLARSLADLKAIYPALKKKLAADVDGRSVF